MSTKAVAYRVLMGRVDVLERLVAEALAEGWQVQGGATFAGGGQLCQAVVRMAQEPRPQSGSI
jgi:hypothetical protein